MTVAQIRNAQDAFAALYAIASNADPAVSNSDSPEYRAARDVYVKAATAAFPDIHADALVGDVYIDACDDHHLHGAVLAYRRDRADRFASAMLDMVYAARGDADAMDMLAEMAPAVIIRIADLVSVADASTKTRLVLTAAIIAARG